MILWTNMETVSPTICPWCHMENKISTQVWKCLNYTNFTFTSQTALDTPEQSTSDPIMTSQSTSFFNKLWLEARKCFIFSSRRVLFCWNATSCYFYTTHIARQLVSRLSRGRTIVKKLLSVLPVKHIHCILCFWFGLNRVASSREK